MAIIENTYTGNGSLTEYSFTFPYLEESDVKVSLDGTVQPTTEYSFANATTISFNTAPANGVAIRIYRETSQEAPPATFFAGSAIRASDLNENFLQQLYVAQETSKAIVDAVAGDIPDGTITSDKLASNLTIDLASGTAGLPSLTFDANTGLYSPGADQVAISTNGTGRLFVDANGNVGINTTSPDNLLHLEDDTGFFITLERTGGSPSVCGVGNSGNVLYLSSNGSGIQFNTGATPTEKARIDASGRLGLGTSLPSAGLTVGLGSGSVPAAGSSGSSGPAALFGNNVGLQTYGLAVGATTAGLGYIQAQRADGTATTYNLTIQPNGGNVGIGNTNPGDRLHVMESSASAATATGASVAQFERFGNAAITVSTSDSGQATLFFGDTTSSTVGRVQYEHSDDALAFWANSAERARITSTGELQFKGAGTNGSPGSPAVSFNGSAPSNSLVINSTGNVGINNANPQETLHIAKTGDSAILQIQQEDSSTTNVYRPAVKLDKENTNLFQLSCDGNALSSGTTYYEAKTAAGQHIFSVNGSQVVYIDSGGRLLINTGTELGGALLQVNGDRVRVATAKTPASASASGETGEICWDSNYVYVCVATNTWKRSALSTW